MLSAIFLFFAYATVVQYNDKDGILWMILYGSSALSIAVYFMKKTAFMTLFPIALSLGFIIWNLIKKYYYVWSDPAYEFYYEMGGCLITLLVLLTIFIKGKRRDHSRI